jgi:glucose-1-phosphate adenylyltransferase
MPPAYFGSDAVCTNSLVSEGCEISGVLDRSILFQGVEVGKGALIKDSILLTGAKIGEGVEITNSIISEDSVIGNGSKIGVGEYSENEENAKIYNAPISVIGYNAVIPENAIIGQNCVIHSGVRPESTENWEIQSGKTVNKKKK